MVLGNAKAGAAENPTFELICVLHEGNLDIFLTTLSREPVAQRLDLVAQMKISYAMDQNPIQDSFRYRARQAGLKVANQLVDARGELDVTRLQELQAVFEKGPYLLGFGLEADVLIYTHIQACLTQLPVFWSQIQPFSPPFCHKGAEDLIRYTLWPERVDRLTVSCTRRAVLAAWFTVLRQAVGSCFATAPAIFVQRQSPGRFFKDLLSLLCLGQLKRVVAGKEYAVPLSLNWGGFELTQSASGVSPGILAALDAAGVLLTPEMACLFEGHLSVEMALRSCLLLAFGLCDEDVAREESLSEIYFSSMAAKQGVVYRSHPTEMAKKVTEWKKQLSQAYNAFQCFADCALLRAWEYSMASFCDVKTEFARWNLYVGLGMHPSDDGGVGAFLLGKVNELLEEYNQKVGQLTAEYEREIGLVHALEGMIHGAVSDVRRNQLRAEWVMQVGIANRLLEERDQWMGKIEALHRFFPHLLEQLNEKFQEFFQELFDPAIHSEDGLVYEDGLAGFRLVYKHGRRDASQWTPISNGAQYIHSLRDFFVRIESDLTFPKEVGPECVTQLMTALIQHIQENPFLEGAKLRSHKLGRRSPWDYFSGGTLETLLEAYCSRDRPFSQERCVPHAPSDLLHFLAKTRKDEPLLAYSPTHAFLLNPQDVQSVSSASAWEWDELMQEHISHRLSERLKEKDQALFLHRFRQKGVAPTRRALRGQLIEALDPAMRYREAFVDAVLYEYAPLFSPKEAEEVIRRIASSFGISSHHRALQGTYFGPFELYRILQTMLWETKGVFSSTNWNQMIAQAIWQIGGRSPLIFADSNWSGWQLAFVLNPATDEEEIWRVRSCGMQGAPLIEWKQWTSQDNQLPWVALSQPHEYV